MLPRPIRALLTMCVAALLLAACAGTPVATPPTAAPATPTTPPTALPVPSEPTAITPPPLPNNPVVPLPLPPLPSLDAGNLGRIEVLRTIGVGQSYAAAFAPDEMLVVATSAGLTWLRLPDLAELWTHAVGPVYTVAASPTRQIVAHLSPNSSNQSLIDLRQVVDGSLVAEVIGQLAVFSPDGTVLATGSGPYAPDPQESYLWQPDGQPLATLVGGEPRFSPDGRFVTTFEASFDRPSQTRVYTVPTGDLVLTVEATTPAFSPDSSQLAVARGGQVEVYSLPAGALQQTVVTTEDAAPAFGSDGQQLLIMVGTDLWVWDLAQQQEVARFPNVNRSFDPMPPFGPRFSPDGASVATVEPALGDCPPSGVRIVAANDGRIIYEDDQSFDVIYAPDGQQVALNIGDGVRVANLAQGQVTDRRMTPYNDLAFSPDGATLALTNWGRDPQGRILGVIELWNLAEGTPLARLQTVPDDFAYQLDRLTYSPDGQRLTALVSYGCSAFGFWKIVTWDVASGQILSEIDELPSSEDEFGMGNQLPTALSIAPDGSLAAWFDDAAGGIVLRPNNGDEDGLIATDTPVTAMAFTPNGTQLLVADAAGQRAYRDLNGGSNPAGGSGDVLSKLVISADGSRVLALLEQGGGLVFDGATLAVITTLELPDGVREARLSADGRFALFTAMGSSLIYDAQTGNRIVNLPTGEEGLLLSPAGQLLATISGGRVMLWGAP
ncbi:MAG: WD40 repeat domain-containing protein [Oscillochloridaceae bacterium umkhey_bin13]